ncbi:2506_t:CDS:2 [Ambispora leptoticha]|uniref:2506_t:CDS:1 n=1 Tax=Ambispora leptoticha TaxID=144679 RepID=A0A9N9F272_9GLOM|nr:2506_t:CDS:2 [Ambispora leptoticha]
MVFVFDFGRKIFKESKSFYSLRLTTAAVVILLYLAYLSFLIYEIVTDVPLLQASLEYLDIIQVPDIEICGYMSDIEISKCVFTWRDWTTSSYDLCYNTNESLPYIYAGPRPETSSSYCYLFTGNRTLYYLMPTLTNADPHSVNHIDFYFRFKNLTSAISSVISVATISAQLYDPDFNPLWGKAEAITTVDKFVQAEWGLQYNSFAGIYNYSTQVRFKKSTIRSILKSDIGAVFGMNPKYHNTSYLETTSAYYPLHPSPDFQFNETHGHFAVGVGSFVQDLQTEKRGHTILGALGVAGGAFGAIGGIYIILFGQPRTKPWGLMHRVAKHEVARNADISNLPFVTPLIDPSQPYQSADQRVSRLENRFQELEVLLSDYFVDASPLKKLRHRRNSSSN